MLPLTTTFTRLVWRQGMEVKSKKGSFKWENLFGRQPLMYEVWPEQSNTNFRQNGKDLILWKKHTRQDIIGWKIRKVRRHIALLVELILRSIMLSFVIWYLPFHNFNSIKKKTLFIQLYITFYYSWDACKVQYPNLIVNITEFTNKQVSHDHKILQIEN